MIAGLFLFIQKSVIKIKKARYKIWLIGFNIAELEKVVDAGVICVKILAT